MDPRGRQEDVILLMENGLKSNGNNSKLGREEKYEPSKPSSKVECAEAEGLQMNRSKAIGRKEIASVSPTIDSAVENVLDAHTENNNKIAGVSLVKGTKTGMEASRWIEKASKAGNTTPSSAFKGQRNNDYSKFFTSSKWDDAGKWLCYDNQQISHPNRANISSASEQIVHSDSSTPSSRGLCVINKQFERTDGSSTASTTDHLNICNNAFKCRSDQILSSSREIRKACNAHDHGAESIQRDQQLLTTQSLSLNQLDVTEVVPECKENECHHATGNWMSARGFMSNVHLIKSSHHAVCHRVAPVSLSDDEVCQHFNHQSQSSLTSILPISTMSVNGRKDNRRAGYNRDLTGGVSDAWMWNDRFLSSDGEIMTKEDWKGVATGACMSDSELCHNYFSDQQFRSSIPGNNKKLRHHIIFQKLRSKYSRGVPDRDSQNEFMIQSPVHGRSASMKDACTEVSPSLSRRDMGTQMTPSAGSPIMSKCTSPARHNTPTCTSPTLDQNGSADVTTRHGDDRVESASAPCLSRCNMTSSGLENCDWTKLEVTGLPSAVTQASERNIDLGSVYYVCSPAKCRLKEEMVINDISEARSDVLITLKECDDLGPRASAWEQAEKAKYNAKYKRAEARIKAWEELQKAKVEGDMKRLEAIKGEIQRSSMSFLMQRARKNLLKSHVGTMNNECLSV
ncbi:hypothetical protein KP509_14G072100 [Ceratopteris richardii]|nr:hypothetical protein KP509_14G072100 [Ceratopteris richardii]